MTTNLLLRLFILTISLSGASALAAPTPLKCTDGQGNALELYASKHLTGSLTLKGSSGAIRHHKIDLGGYYGRMNYAILAASPMIHGEFFFDAPIVHGKSAVKSVSFHSGHWGWSEQINLSLRCLP